jgi:YD repeat-containing protein
MVKNNKQNLLAKLFCYFTEMKYVKLNQSKFSCKMTKKSKIYLPAFFLLTCMFSFSVHAQYYYKDIWNNQQLMKEFSLLKKDNLKTIKIKSFEDDGQPSDGFYCEKKINKNYTQSQMISKSNITGQSLLVTDYNADGCPVKLTDNTPTTISTTQYEYDNLGRLSVMRMMTKADDDSSGISETHEYFYDDKGRPVKMLQKKNNVLISTIQFVSDSTGNIIEEDIKNNNSTVKKYYYYYDDKNQLTDVVHYNERAKRLLPNYMYEYTSFNQPKQMISTEEGGSNYLIWKYTYNDQNLRETEKCFSKERRLLGTIEYEYQ